MRTRDAHRRTESTSAPSCGGNLLVEYDLDVVRRAWRRDDLERRRRSDDLALCAARCRSRAGSRARRSAGRLSCRRRPGSPPVSESASLQIKDDGRNPSASFKDRASAIALQRARENGHDLVTGASTGNAASATAVLAAAVGIRTRIFVPRTAPRAKIAQLLTFGAEVLAVDGTYDQAFDLCLEATPALRLVQPEHRLQPLHPRGQEDRLVRDLRAARLGRPRPRGRAGRRRQHHLRRVEGIPRVRAARFHRPVPAPPGRAGRGKRGHRPGRPRRRRHPPRLRGHRGRLDLGQPPPRRRGRGPGDPGVGRLRRHRLRRRDPGRDRRGRARRRESSASPPRPPPGPASRRPSHRGSSTRPGRSWF